MNSNLQSLCFKADISSKLVVAQVNWGPKSGHQLTSATSFSGLIPRPDNGTLGLEG